RDPNLERGICPAPPEPPESDPVAPLGGVSLVANELERWEIDVPLIVGAALERQRQFQFAAGSGLAKTARKAEVGGLRVRPQRVADQAAVHREAGSELVVVVEAQSGATRFELEVPETVRSERGQPHTQKLRAVLVHTGEQSLAIEVVHRSLPVDREAGA